MADGRKCLASSSKDGAYPQQVSSFHCLLCFVTAEFVLSKIISFDKVEIFDRCQLDKVCNLSGLLDSYERNVMHFTYFFGIILICARIVCRPSIMDTVADMVKGLQKEKMQRRQVVHPQVSI